MDEIASITSFGNSSLINCPWSDSDESIDESIGSVSTTSTTSFVLRTRNAQLLCTEPALIKARESLLETIHLKREFIIAGLKREDSDLSIGRNDLKHSEKCKQQCVTALTVEISLLRRILQVLTETETAIKRQREKDSCQPQAIKNTRGLPGEFKEEIISKVKTRSKIPPLLKRHISADSSDEESKDPRQEVTTQNHLGLKKTDFAKSNASQGEIMVPTGKAPVKKWRSENIINSTPKMIGLLPAPKPLTRTKRCFNLVQMGNRK